MVQHEFSIDNGVPDRITGVLKVREIKAGHFTIGIVPIDLHIPITPSALLFKVWTETFSTDDIRGLRLCREVGVDEHQYSDTV